MNSNLKLSYNLKKHSSLYSLTKNLSNRTISNSKSRSNSKNNSKSNSKEKINIIKSNKIILNSKLFEKINNELFKSHNKKYLNISKSKIKKEINYSLNQTLRNNSQKIMNSKNEKNKNEKKENNEIKNLEQLKKIKSTLEDNLKYMFNFSYENFLNKESETESKKSLEDNIQYKKKYNY